MDRHELLTGFIRENLAVLTQPTLPPKLYKTNKHDYFVTRHADSRQGVPRDTEIANEVVWFLIRHGQVKTKEDLERFLSRGLLAEKVFDPQVFYEFLDFNKPAEPLIDFKKIRQTEFLDSIKEQIRIELRKEMTLDRVTDIEKEIQRKLAEYEALPSVIDAKEYALPLKPPEEVDTEENLEWWQRLHLTDDPFPATEGLFKIKPESYEAVVIKTKIFQKYIKYMESTPAEIFKNTIFFGEFGSGKTTLFQYLRKALETHKIYSVYVHLSFEKDFQSLKIVFKEKLVTELRNLIGDDDQAAGQELGDIDVELIGLMNRLNQKLKPKGLVVFIDDLNKSREGYPVALEFLSYLQVFTYEMAEKITLDNIGFYVAGALEWEPTVRTQPRYSGSLARPEIIPDITEEEAWMMLNRRLEAFYPNPELKREVDRGFVSQVYRDLKTNKLELTFRRFIRRLVAEFKASNFKVLVSDPVHIPPETLQKIKAAFDSDPILRERFRTLLNDKLRTQEDRIVCVRLLLTIFLREKTNRRLRDADLEMDYLPYLQQLATTGLISKVPEGKDDHTWAVCRDLRDKNKEISVQFSLSLEDYLLKIYGIGPARRRGANEEIQQIKDFAEKCEVGARSPLEKVLTLHEEIIEALETYSLATTESELLRKCQESLNTLTQFFIDYIERPESPDGIGGDLTFWKDFWFFPDEIAEFQNVLSDEEDCRRKIWYVMGVYRDAFNVLFPFVRKEYQSLNSVHISSSGLDKDETGRLITARDLWTSGGNERCAAVLYNHIQGKMRTFAQNALTLIYGESPNRIRHIEEKTRHKILDAISTRTISRGVPFLETNSLSLEDLVNLMTDARGTASTNLWHSVFSKLLRPATVEDLAKYCDKLSLLKNRNSEGDTAIDESLELREIILTTVDLTRRMNTGYLLLLKSLYIESESGGPKMYLSLDALSDKAELIGISFQTSLAQALVGSMRSGEIQLDNYEFIQDYYSMPFRVFYMYLALIIDEARAKSMKVSTGYVLEKTRGSTIYLKKVFKFSEENPPRISLAHSGRDESFVKSLASDLRRNGIRVWLDNFELKEGDPITQSVHEPIKENDYLGVVLSPSSVESEWITKDLSTTLVRELEKKAILVLPILYKECKIPPVIADKKTADFTSTHQRGLEDLLSRIEETTPKEVVSPIEERISNRENSKTERKSAFKFDLKLGVASRALEKAISKTVAAFMNAEGGELFIGVDDEGNIIGLSGDFSLIGKQNSDGFELELRQSLDKYLKDNIIWELLEIRFETVRGKQLCHVLVSPCSRPIILHDEGKQEFYVRVGNMSRPYSLEEFHDYSKRRFK